MEQQAMDREYVRRHAAISFALDILGRDSRADLATVIDHAGTIEKFLRGK